MLSPAARAINIRPIKDLVDSGNLAGVKKGWRGSRDRRAPHASVKCACLLDGIFYWRSCG